MSKERSPVADYLVYLVVRVIVCVIQALSFDTARSLARGLAWLAYRIDRRHREVAAENLRHAFPNRYSEEELTRLVKAVYLHLCTLIMEIAHLQRKMNPNTWRRHLDLVSGRQVVGALLSGRPLMMVTGHFGNWELASFSLGLLGFPTAAVARPLDNPYIDDFLRKFRESSGQTLLAKKGDFDQMQAILDRGGALGTLGDQDAGQRGPFVDFFGRPASTHKAIALLILEHKVPLMVIVARKKSEPMFYEVVAEDVIYPEEYEGKPDAVKAITQRFTSALERLIRTAPEQYFWLHRRWKHQPAVKAKRQAAVA
jgi:KDO2-lipid IV(A) lauroyltransferase